MTRACHAAVRMATGDAFTDAEIEDFLNRLASQAKRKRVAEPTLSEREAIAAAAGELTKDRAPADVVHDRSGQ